MEALEPLSSIHGQQIRDQYHAVLDRIQRAAQVSGRDPDSIRLVVVTKGQPVNVIQEAIAAGARILGENYPEQAVEKIQWLGLQSSVEWHMIGHVQSRKTRMVAEHFTLIHSVDSLKLANKLNENARTIQRRLPILLEINLGEEESKFGWRTETSEEMTATLRDVEAILQMDNLAVRGLMAMPPLLENAEASRPYFQQLRRHFKDWSNRFPQADWKELSMGTSFDFEIAVQEGATLVRVGEAVLGPRPKR